MNLAAASSASLMGLRFGSCTIAIVYHSDVLSLFERSSSERGYLIDRLGVAGLLLDHATPLSGGIRKRLPAHDHEIQGFDRRHLA